MKNSTDFDVIVVGGGASGMMAAICAGRRGKKVLLLEKNKILGNKLSISGGGRCNITNTNPDKSAFIKNYGDMAKFLHSPLSKHGVQDSVAFFKDIGIEIVTEARYRAFPISQSAPDVTEALKREIKKLGVHIRTGESVKKIETKKGKISKIITNTEEYQGAHIILSTGGMSHPETGSTGDGFSFLREFGHKVHTPSPSIVPLAVKESWVKKLSGTSLENMKISFYLEEKSVFKKTGKILFTHFGVSGPLILNCSKKVGDLLHSGVVTARINLYPDLDERALEEKTLKIFDIHKNKTFKNVISECVPRGMDETILSLSKIEGTTKVHSVTKEERKRLQHLIQNLPLTVTGQMGYDRAVVADGGVDISEIDMKTMKSKKVSNLSVTGDLLHIHRPSGGFSLQLCWTTGYIAGQNA
jgi:predicted Rossmann fold flavoprotein